MNILDINKEIYGYKNLGEGNNINFIMKSIEEQETKNLNIDNFNNRNDSDLLNGMYKEIKF